MWPAEPAPSASDQAAFSPVHPAGTAVEAQESTHEDEASLFWNRGIPGFSVGGVQDSNIDENPYPRPPLTMAANSVMAMRAMTWLDKKKENPGNDVRMSSRRHPHVPT